MVRARTVIDFLAIGIAAGAVVMANGVPAAAVTPGSVAARMPSYNATTRALAASGTFVNVAAATATYTYTVQLLRSSSSTRPTCPAAGCVTAGVVKVVAGRTGTALVKSGGVGTVAASAVCALGTTNPVAYYWSWVKIADASGNVVVSTGSPISGRYC